MIAKRRGRKGRRCRKTGYGIAATKGKEKKGKEEEDGSISPKPTYLAFPQRGEEKTRKEEGGKEEEEDIPSHLRTRHSDRRH